MADPTRSPEDPARANAALREELDLYKALAENAAEGVYVNQDMVLVYANPSLLRMAGASAADWIGKSFLPVVAPEYREVVLQRNTDRHAGRPVPARYEIELLHADGSRRPVEISVATARYRGRPATIGIVRDVSERRRTERIARIQHQLAAALAAEIGLPEALRLILDAAIGVSDTDCGGVYLVDPATGVVRLAHHRGLSDAFVARTAIYPADSPEAQLIRAGAPNYLRVDEVPPHLREHPAREGLRAIDRIRAIAAVPVHHAGRVVACVNVASHIRDEIPADVRTPLETLVAQVGSAVARLRAEEDLRESEANYRRLVDLSPDAVTVVAADGRIAYVNPAGAAMYGASSAAELLGRDPADLAHPDFAPLVRERMRRWAETGEPLEPLEVPGVRLDGSPIVVESRSAVFSDRGKPALLSLVRDVTERARMLREREALEEQLRQSQKLEAIGRLAGGVAHDFNNILMGIVGGASLLRRHLPADSPATSQVRMIEQSAECAALLTNQLLAFARGGKYLPLPQDLNAVVAEAMTLIRPSLLAATQVEMALADELPPIEADRAQVLQVLMNLCQNAKEAIGKSGRIGIETFAADRATLPPVLRDRPEPFVGLSVWDTGHGVPADQREHVFDPFFTTKDYGRGLGLAAVYGIARNHHGSAVCDQGPGGGARFTVYFPTASADARRAEAGGERPAANGSGPLTVLVVDEDDIAREMAATMLESIGHAVRRAASGKSAVQFFRRHAGRIDLVLIAVTMARSDGVETCRRLLDLRPDARVVFTSDYAEEVPLPEGMRPAVRGVLKKPFTLPELAEALRNAT
jgi:PAS domain S-box-containing protein